MIFLNEIVEEYERRNKNKLKQVEKKFLQENFFIVYDCWNNFEEEQHIYTLN